MHNVPGQNTLYLLCEEATFKSFTDTIAERLKVVWVKPTEEGAVAFVEVNQIESMVINAAFIDGDTLAGCEFEMGVHLGLRVPMYNEKFDIYVPQRLGGIE